MRTVKGTTFVVCLALWLVLPLPHLRGAAQFNLSINNVTWPGATGTGYDVFDTGGYPYTANFTLLKSGGGAQFYFVTFGHNAQGNYNRVLQSGGNQLKYQLYVDSSLTQVLKDLPDATSGEIIQGQSPPQNPSTIPLTYLVHIIPGQVPPPGLYTDSVSVKVYRGKLNGSQQLDDSATISVSARVKPVADLALVTSGAPFSSGATSQTLDFGTLVEGKTMGCDLRIRSNVGYTISFASDHRGVLASTDPSITDTIPYALRVRGQLVNLNQSQVTLDSTASQLTDSNGQAYDLAVTIGACDNPTAGNYRDNFTITVVTK